MHRGYGHLNFDTLRKVLGWPRAKTGGNPNYRECKIVKSQRSALSKSTFKRSVRPIHRMHMDVMFGAFSKYVFQLTADDHGRRSWLQQMQDKSQTLATFKLLKSKVENDKGHTRWLSCTLTAVASTTTRHGRPSELTKASSTSSPRPTTKVATA